MSISIKISAAGVRRYVVYCPLCYSRAVVITPPPEFPWPTLCLTCAGAIILVSDAYDVRAPTRADWKWMGERFNRQLPESVRGEHDKIGQ